MVIHINSTAEFDTQIANNSKVIIDFFATWCGPCKMLSPVLEKIADENPDITILKVDVDKLSELAVKYAVYSIPQMNFFKDGKEVGEPLVGFRGSDALMEEISSRF